ncbi:MAG: acyltransferase [Myxococcaceae bacterium]|nr:acyltransferase [Myxococcaceae bacterium]
MSAASFTTHFDERLPVLDGLRGIAVSLVILFHCAIDGPRYIADASPLWVGLGWSGVDLFFVLSGFLITRILLATRDDEGYFKKFYARRVLRIFPLFYLYLLVFFVLHQGLGGASWMQLTHLSNWYVQLLGDWGPESPSNLTWSLSIEEQYYLVWPFVVFHLRDSKLKLACWAMVVGALLVRFSFLAPQAPAIGIYVSTLARVDTFAMGGLVALSLRAGTLSKTTPLIVLGLGAFATAAVIAWQHTFVFASMAPGALVLFLSCLAATYASALAALVRHRQTPWARKIFENPLLVKLGKHSYAMYLFHVEVIFGLKWLFETGPLGFFSSSPPALAVLAFWLLAFTLTLGLSVALWHLLEKRFLALKKHFAYA